MSAPRNPALRDSCKEFVIASLDLMQELRSNKGYVVPLKNRWVISTNPIRVEQRPFVDFEDMLREVESKIRATPEHMALQKSLKEDYSVKGQVDRDVGTEWGQWPVTAESCSTDFLLRYGQLAGSLQFRDDVFDKFYEEFEDFFYGDEIHYRVVTPLTNMVCESELIDLGDGVRIIRLTRPLLEELMNEHFGYVGLSITDFLDIPFAIVHDYNTKKVVLQQSSRSRAVQVTAPRWQEVPLKVLSALRLLKRGVLGRAFTSYKCTQWVVHLSSGSFGVAGPTRTIGFPYELSAQDVPELQRFWNQYKLRDLESSQPIDLVIRRFNHAQERFHTEDMLIDHIVSLEALMLPDVRQELEYRLAVRTAVLLGDSPTERLQIFKDIREAYRTRSNIIHGGLVKNSGELLDMVDKVQEYLRLAIRKFIGIMEMESHKRLVSQLDEQLFKP